MHDASLPGRRVSPVGSGGLTQRGMRSRVQLRKACPQICPGRLPRDVRIRQPGGPHMEAHESLSIGKRSVTLQDQHELLQETSHVNKHSVLAYAQRSMAY